MKVLVTGHHGYLGSVLAPLLAKAGHDVVGYDTQFYRGCDFGEDGACPAGVLADVRDVTSSGLEGLDAIVHLAALSNDPLGDLDPGLTNEVNGDGTLRLARAARDAGVVRFVFASSCAMYGDSGTDEPLGEDAPLRPLTAYAESKVRAEESLVELADSDFAPVSMRNATAFGASPRLRLDIVLNNLTAWAHTTGMVRLTSDGSAWRPMVHIRDISKATLALLKAEPDVIAGEAFNIGTQAQNYRVRDLADVVSVVTGCDVEIAEGSSSDQRSYRVDFSKLARKFPALRFDWDAERGARELIDAYREVGLTLEDLEGDRYVRLRKLSSLLDEGKLDNGLRWRTPEVPGGHETRGVG